MMKYIIILFLILIHSGCRKAEIKKDVVISVDTNNIIKIGDRIIKAENLDIILEFVAPRMSNSAFIINLSSDSVSNSLPYLTMGEKHGITNFCVRTKQVFPPSKPNIPVAIE